MVVKSVVIKARGRGVLRGLAQRQSSSGRAPRGGRGRQQEERSNRPRLPLAVEKENEDWLAAGLIYIDNKKGNVVKQLPKSEEKPLLQVRDEFLKRDAQVPGPVTVVYRPQEEPKLPPPAPRSIEELADYIDNTHHVDLEALSHQPDYFQTTVHTAWHILSRNPYFTEVQKKAMMEQIYRNLDKYKDDDTLDRILAPPSADSDADDSAQA